MPIIRGDLVTRMGRPRWLLEVKLDCMLKMVTTAAGEIVSFLAMGSVDADLGGTVVRSLFLCGDP